MGIKELEGHLERKGKEEIAAIRKERDDELNALEAEVAEAIQKSVEQIRKDGTKEADSVKKRILARAKMEAKDRIEGEKMRIAEEVLEKARERVLGSSDSEKKKILKGLADEARAEVKNPVVRVDKRYAALLPGARAADIGDFGVVVEGSESGVRIDNTLSAKLDRMRDELMPGIIKALFKG